MEYRTLGRSGLRVSVLGFGCGDTGGLMIRGDPGERERTVARALELGVNYFDTAPSYGQGESEIQLGRVLKHLSAEPYLGTKVGLEVSEMHAPDRAITRSLEASLRRLGRERVDLLQIHNQIGATRSPDGAVLAVEDLREGVIPVLEKLKQQGKIRLWGITGLGEIGPLHRLLEDTDPDTVQVCYNLLNPSAGATLPPGYPARVLQRLAATSTVSEFGRSGDPRPGRWGLDRHDRTSSRKSPTSNAHYLGARLRC